MSNPMAVEEWVYNQVMNYMPGPMEQGLSPEQGAQILTRYGFPVDWARLGVVDIGAEWDRMQGVDRENKQSRQP